MTDEERPLYDVTIKWRGISGSRLKGIAAQHHWPPILLDSVEAGARALITAENDAGDTIFVLSARPHKKETK